ncbi:ABC transporter substrate-binding protein [Frondihabitans australicus]|uniref:Peptide/nickel transport system substrate-binding protein n=1 Tax=Frondihabitans australicus TaxID=386892 RepID=A0A495IDT4_9MICO|nr:ABC transporter substrate-binding protein [Frondihabitans australicus]RKR73295.1 peptide/nickel transport system substrate-binding protein [Frondihabitans australicus]
MSPSDRSRPRRRLTTLLTGIVAFAIALTGCTAASGASEGTSSGSETLDWASAYPPTSWDPVVNGSGASFRVTSLAYASLTTTNEQGEAEPALAKSWKYNSDGTQVTFTLRSGLKFSDGTALDSTAVKDYFVRAQTQKTSALVGEGISVIKSIDTPDATSVVMNLSQPDYQIPLVVAERVGQITNPKYTTAQLAQKPEGAGPFKAVTVVPGSKAVLVKNPNYWDAKNIHITNVTVSFGIDPTQVVTGLQSGVYDFADLATSQAKSAKAAGLDVVQQPGFNANNLSVNTTIAPFNNPKVLEAVQYAVNREQIVDQADFGYGTAAYEPFPKGYIAYDPTSADAHPFSVSKAKALLAEAGYPNGFAVTMTVSSTSTTAENELLQAQLKAVGIDVTLKVDANWATSFFAKKLPISTYGTTGRDSPVQTLQAHFGAAGALNLSGKDGGAAYDAAISKALATPLTSPDYQKNIQAATAAGMATTGLIFTDTVPNLFVKTKAVSSIPKIPAKITWTGVTIGGSN